MTAAEPTLRPAPPASRRPSGAASTRPAPAAAAGSTSGAASSRPSALGWQMEANWTDPFLFFIYSVAKPLASALILVVMLEVISGGARPEYRAFVVVGSALWSFVLSGISGLAWMILDDRERYRMLKYVYVSPSDFLAVMLRSRRGPDRRRRDGRSDHARWSASSSWTSRSTSAGSTGSLLVVAMVLGVTSILAIGLILAAICMQTRQESWSYPGGRRRRAVPHLRGRLPAGGPADAGPGARAPDAADVVDRGRSRHALFPGGLSAIGGPGALYTELTGAASPSPSDDRPRVAGDRSGGYTRGSGRLPGERPAREGSRAVRPDDRLLIDGHRGSRRRPRPTLTEGGSMRIYEGSPRQDFEEVFRSIGAFIDQRGMREILLVEAPDGFIVQGLVAAGAAGSAWSDALGTPVRRRP